jgi:hypothetical protein
VSSPITWRNSAHGFDAASASSHVLVRDLGLALVWATRSERRLAAGDERFPPLDPRCIIAGMKTTHILIGLARLVVPAAGCAGAMSSCNPASSSFYVGSTCPAGHTSRCTQTLEGQTAVTHYYPGFGDGTTEYALMTCQAIGGAFSSP